MFGKCAHDYVLGLPNLQRCKFGIGNPDFFWDIPRERVHM